jgi:hypothetical protein
VPRGRTSSETSNQYAESMGSGLLLAVRLVDRAETTGRANPTLRSLPPLIADEGSKSKSEALANNVRDDCVNLTDWRDRRLGHCDLAIAQGTYGVSVLEIRIADTDKALA